LIGAQRPCANNGAIENCVVILVPHENFASVGSRWPALV
jgi:hypothetical protein